MKEEKTRKVNKGIPLCFLFYFFLLGSTDLYSQKFAINYKGKEEAIDSIIFFDTLYNRINSNNNFLVQNEYKNVNATFFLKNKKRICIGIDFSRIYCDTIRINLIKLPDSKIKLKRKLIGTYQTCNFSSHTVGFYSDTYPCCKRRKRR